MEWFKGDETLFARMEPSQLNACQHLYGTLTWYATGYQELLEQTANNLRKRPRLHDAMLFPIANDWRHCLELLLKALIRVTSVDGGFPQHHKLGKLWTAVEPVLRERYPNKALEPHAHVKRLLGELERIDPDACGFRYPFTTKGQPTLTQLPDAVNIDNLDRVMRKIANLLSATIDDLTAGEGEDAVPVR